MCCILEYSPSISRSKLLFCSNFSLRALFWASSYFIYTVKMANSYCFLSMYWMNSSKSGAVGAPCLSSKQEAFLRCWILVGLALVLVRRSCI